MLDREVHRHHHTQFPDEKGERTVNRSLEEVNDEFINAGNTFDGFVSEAIENAHQHGLHTATVFDIGSGKGFVGYSFKASPEDSPDTSKILATYGTQQPMKLRIVGLTDAREVGQQGMLLPIDVDDYRRANSEVPYIPNPLVDVENYTYSLTRRQSVDTFLRQTGVENLAMAFALQSLRYFSPSVFAEAVTTTVDRLIPGGRFFIWHLSETLRGYTDNDHDRFTTVARSKDDPLRLVDVLNQNIRAHSDLTIFARALIPEDPHEQVLIKRAIEMLRRLQVIKDANIQEIEEKLASHPVFSTRSSRERELWLSYQVIRLGHQRLVERRLAKQHQRRVDFLSALPGVVVESVTPGIETMAHARTNILAQRFVITKL